MRTHNFNIPLTVVMVQDPHIGGYTAYFKQFPDIIAEGDTDDEAMNNLMNAVHDVFVYKSTDLRDEFAGRNYKVINRPGKFCIQ